ncbi:huntingtin isoform X2 [Uranotaenia lowii]|uniref:huntingtin isoform X2 n=1 Tax=Uranotaenia lowii TaxID=190385 RepID=UPI0024791668|nr:huntingtin isoform X2 [Uranotaenia lowii]
MDKLSVFSSLQKSIDTLKSTECSQKEKITHFGNISESIVSVRQTGSANFQNHLSSAVATLLLFCEEADSGVRMSAEENLNRIVRYAEGHGALVRIQIDLYHEIKKNGHERSLRICLNLFGHYCDRIKQRKGETYAKNLLPCMFAISKRRETQVLESLASFVKMFSEKLESYMTDWEVMKMTEVFIEDLTAECATKRRCAAQNIDSFIAGSRWPEVHANNAFNRCIEILLKNQEQNAVLGVLTCFRGILPHVLKSAGVDKSIEVLDLLLQFLKDGSHSVVNATLEVISVILNSVQPATRKVLLSQEMEHQKMLLKRKTLKNSIFKINLSESLLSSRKSSTDARMDSLRPGSSSFLQVTSTPTKFAPGDDKSLASASDLEMESFRSMEFDNSFQTSESSPEKESKPKPVPDSVSLRSQKSTDSIGSFFNTFLNTSSSAGESVSKFFRKPFDSPGGTAPLLQQTEDLESLESLASSQISMNSSSLADSQTIRVELDVTAEADDDGGASSVAETVTLAPDVGDAVLIEPDRDGVRIEVVTGDDSSGPLSDDPDRATPVQRDLFIGSIHDQNILDYTTRLIASKFLLSGSPRGLVPDYVARVSVKSMALQILGQCVQLRPEVLLLPLEKDEPKEEFDVVEILSLEDAINEIVIGDSGDSPPGSEENEAGASALDHPDGGLPLEIKEDHFGECTSSTYFDYFSPMSISLDQGLSSLKLKLKEVEENFGTMASDSQEKLSKELDAILSQSDCSGEMGRKKGSNMLQRPHRTELLVVPRVVTTTRKSGDSANENQQFAADILLFYDHADQTLRGNVLSIVANLLAGSLNQNGSVEAFLICNERRNLSSFLSQEALLHVIAKGLLDEIHTVVNQALSALEQTLPVLCRCQHSSKTRTRIPTVDQFSFKTSSPQNVFTRSESLPPIDVQALVTKLTQVFYNRYWLVQCKLCDVISNLDFKLLIAALDDGEGQRVQKLVLDQLVMFLGDDDIRVRNHAAERIITYIENVSSNNWTHDIQMDEGIVSCFVNEYILATFAEPVDRRKFTKITGDKKAFQKTTSQIFYVLSNALLNVDDRNQLFGIIGFIKLFVHKYDPLETLNVWNEFNLLSVLSSLMMEHPTTALDLTAQTDLLDLCSSLMIVISSARTNSPSTENEKIDKFIFHVLKILNMFQHLFSGTKPVIIAKPTKGDLFMNTKELRLVNCFGYFGNDQVYLKLYNLLRNSFESYKITIAADVSQKFFDLLRSTITALWRLLEIKHITSMTNGFKFIEEVLRYLTVFLPYEPEHCVRCTRYLLRFLFSCNYVNRVLDVGYFRKQGEILDIADVEGCQAFLERYFEFCKFKSVSSTSDLGNYIKQFEQVVIACLKMYSKATVPVQTAILELLCQLVQFNINYQLLDASNVFVDCVIKHVELLEKGTIQDCERLIEQIVRFLFLLTHMKDQNKVLVNVPKIINMCDNLLANAMARGPAIASVQSLADEIFFFDRSSVGSPEQSGSGMQTFTELATQKEVILNMMIKFPHDVRSYRKIPMLLVFGRNSNSATFEVQVFNALMVGGIQDGKMMTNKVIDLIILDHCLTAFGKEWIIQNDCLQIGLKVLFKLQKGKDYPANQKLAYSQLILENILLNTEENNLLVNLKRYLNDVNGAQDDSELDTFVNLLIAFLCESVETVKSQATNHSEINCAVKIICTVRKFSKFPAVAGKLLEKVEIHRLHIKSSCQQIQLELANLLLYLGYELKTVVDLIGTRKNSIQNDIAVYELIKTQKEIKPTKVHWNTEEVSYLINNHLDILIGHFSSFLLSYVASTEYSSVIVKGLLDHQKQSTTHFNLLERSHLSSLSLFADHLTRILAVETNIIITRKSALVLDAKLQLLLASQPLDSITVQKILPDQHFRNLFGTISASDRRKKYPKLFKTALLLCPFYEGIETPRDLIPQVDTDQLKQVNVDEAWFMQQVAFHCTSGRSYTKPKNVSRMLLEVNSESRLINLLSTGGFNLRLLQEIIDTAFEHMCLSFRKDCVQFNPHLNYLKVHPMLKVALIVLMRKLDEINSTDEDRWDREILMYCVKSAICFLENLSKLEHLCLIYVEARFIEKFVKDNILKSQFYESLLMLACNCNKLVRSSIRKSMLQDSTDLELYLKCTDLILQQRQLWNELNQNDKYHNDRDFYVQTVFEVLKVHLRGSLFLDRYRTPEVFATLMEDRYEEVEIYLQTVFIAHYIAEKDTMKGIQEANSVLLKILESLAVSVLKTDRFYPYALTPGEVLNCYNFDVDVDPLKLPSVPIDYLYEPDMLQAYLKRVNIFGYSTKQQFEELFMSLLVLINRDGDPDMMTFQEQLEIKSVCLRAIMSLLLSCYRYPRIGSHDGKFHHVPRNHLVKCTSVGLKKLHNIQLLIPLSNVFYQPNLERRLIVTTTADNRQLLLETDSCIGTVSFGWNQFAIRHSWELMEFVPEPSLEVRNLRYFVEKANLDVTSSVQLIHNVLGQLLEENSFLALSHLVKFCEICENRDQIRQLYVSILALQERVPMEDTISQQHIIYLLCKMAALLEPTMPELTHLCMIIPTYLKSTQLFIRNATLSGLLALLECLVTSNTTIGALSEELQLLRNIIVNYIIKHGIIDESSSAYSDTHTILVWTLNFYLIENTSRFVADCNLFTNSVISANNILKRTANLDIYLCILNGLERLVLTNTAPRLLLEKIEKLALELVKLDNEMFSLAALKLLVTCIYHGSAEQLELTERSNGIVQDEPEIIIQQIEKIEILFAKIRTTTPAGARIFGDVLCTLIRDLLPPNEILTKVFKELMLNQPNPDIIAIVTHQVFRSAIDSSYLALLQEWLLCSLPNFLSFPQINKSIWCLTVMFLSASLNQHLLKLFPEVLSLPSYQQLNEREMNNFILSARDFYRNLDPSQKTKFRDMFQQNHQSSVYSNLLQCL